MSSKTAMRTMRRDGFKCAYCEYDAAASFENWRHGGLGIDYVISRAKGGGTEDDNLMTLCAACKLDKPDIEFASIEDARRWIRLYRKEYARAWFRAYVEKNEPTVWPAKEQLQRTWDLFNAGEGSKPSDAIESRALDLMEQVTGWKAQIAAAIAELERIQKQMHEPVRQAEARWKAHPLWLRVCVRLWNGMVK